MRFASIMKTDILISGSGGQGLMILGKIIVRAAQCAGKQVIWFPSYGAEQRGGTAHCYVKISDQPIASPLVDLPDTAVILNQPSMDKFQKKFTKLDLLIFNSDLTAKAACSKAAQCLGLPLATLAHECGSLQVINSIILGILTASCGGFLKKQTALTILKETFKEDRTLESNLKAFNRGIELVSSNAKDTQSH